MKINDEIMTNNFNEIILCFQFRIHQINLAGNDQKHISCHPLIQQRYQPLSNDRTVQALPKNGLLQKVQFIWLNFRIAYTSLSNFFRKSSINNCQQSPSIQIACQQLALYAIFPSLLPSYHKQSVLNHGRVFISHPFWFLVLLISPILISQLPILDVQKKWLVDFHHEIPSQQSSNDRGQQQRPYIPQKNKPISLDPSCNRLKTDGGCRVNSSISSQSAQRQVYLRTRKRDTGMERYICHDLLACEVYRLVKTSTHTVNRSDPTSSFMTNLTGSSQSSHPSWYCGSMLPSRAHDHNPPSTAPISCALRYSTNLLCLLSTYVPKVITGLMYPPVTSPVRHTARKKEAATIISGATCSPAEHVPQTSMKLPRDSKKSMWNLRLLMSPFIWRNNYKEKPTPHPQK